MGIFTDKGEVLEKAAEPESDGIGGHNPLVRGRLALRCHLTMRQPIAARVFDIDEVVGIDVDPAGAEGRSRHSLYVSSVTIVPAEVRAVGGEPVELPGQVDVTYALTTLRWAVRAEESDRR
jgi:hypothetical protein